MSGIFHLVFLEPVDCLFPENLESEIRVKGWWGYDLR